MRSDRARSRRRRPKARRAAAAAAAAAAASPSALAAFLLLAAARLASAAFNIVHDCDETFNYLEPLHFLLHGSGMQARARVLAAVAAVGAAGRRDDRPCSTVLDPTLAV